MSSAHDEDALGRIDRALLRRLLAYATPHRRLFATSVVVLFLGFGVELIGPTIVQLAIDGPIAGYLAGTLDFVDARAGLLLWIGTYLVALVLIAWVRYGEVTLMAATGQAVVLDIRRALFRHLQALSPSFYDKNPVGRLVTRVTGDVEALNELFTSGVVILIRDVVKILGVVAFLFWIHAGLALIVCVFVPPLIGLSLAFRNQARSSHHLVRGKNALLNGYTTEAVMGMRVIQLFGQEGKARSKFAKLTDDYLRANLRTIFWFALFYPLVEFVLYAMEGTVIWRAAHAISLDTLTPGRLLQFWLIVEVMAGPIRELGEKYNVLQAAMASSERIFRVLDTPSEVRPPAEPRSPRVAKRGAIRFEQVGFSYDGVTPVLRGIDFAAAPGERIALVGATGAGKSTVISLLARFYDAQSGRITVDGQDVRDYDPRELRARIAVVPQDVFLFAGTIEENISLGREGIDHARVVRAAEAVLASRFIERLPGGYSAPVAERGATFSTGQRQLLAFARALAGDPDLIVLDEATAHIDTETEDWIQEGLKHLLEGRTAVVIAHRLSTITSSDRILVFHHGEIREIGTHAELLAKNGIYARLYRLQFA
ncbi:MAG: ABC transporter ATP-binding protein [Planctomycetes bacterium]|nr:ABC transporter ATP-binding protein [Planctomycetota bacterium]